MNRKIQIGQSEVWKLAKAGYKERVSCRISRISKRTFILTISNLPKQARVVERFTTETSARHAIFAFCKEIKGVFREVPKQYVSYIEHSRYIANERAIYEARLSERNMRRPLFSPTQVEDSFTIERNINSTSVEPLRTYNAIAPWYVK